MPASASSKLRLAVARDAGKADNLAATQGEGDVVDARHAAIVAHDEIARFERDLAGVGGDFLDLEDHFASDHCVSQFRRRCPGGFESRDHFASAHDGDAVGQMHDLAQLMGDENDCLVLRLQHFQHFEQLIGLRRRQDRRRLVKNQDLRAADKRLQNLDALLQTDGEFADDGVGIDLQSIFAGEMRELFAERACAAGEQRAAFRAEHDIFEDAQRLDEHEMLMHHADAASDRFAR